MAKKQLTRQEKSTREQEQHHLSHLRERAEKIHKKLELSAQRRADGIGWRFPQEHGGGVVRAHKADVRECLTMLNVRRAKKERGG